MGKIVNFHTKLHLPLSAAMANKFFKDPSVMVLLKEEYKDAKEFAEANQVEFKWSLEQWVKVKDDSYE